MPKEVVILSTFAALSAGCAKDLSAQLAGQSFTVTPDTSAASVGDSISISFRIRLHERDLPLDSIPQIVGALPPGVRLLSVEKLTRSADRVYQGGAQIAFYRPGRRPVPVFGLPFMRIVEGVTRATLPSDSAFVDISAVLPPGNQGLKDIRELETRPVAGWRWLALGLTLLAAGFYFRVRRKRAAEPVRIAPDSSAEPPSRTAYDVAVECLARVEAERWPVSGQVDLHYEAAGQALRRYLEDAHGVAALERTTAELVWALPPLLGSGGLRDRCREVLGEADLVKFAEVRPDAAAAAQFLDRCRNLLTDWHTTASVEEIADALR
jgi:hypothetical protein